MRNVNESATLKAIPAAGGETLHRARAERDSPSGGTAGTVSPVTGKRVQRSTRLGTRQVKVLP